MRTARSAANSISAAAGRRLLRAAMAAIGLAYDRTQGLLEPTEEDEKATRQSREKKARKAEREAKDRNGCKPVEEKNDDTNGKFR